MRCNRTKILPQISDNNGMLQEMDECVTVNVTMYVFDQMVQHSTNPTTTTTEIRLQKPNGTFDSRNLRPRVFSNDCQKNLNV